MPRDNFETVKWTDKDARIYEQYADSYDEELKPNSIEFPRLSATKNGLDVVILNVNHDWDCGKVILTDIGVDINDLINNFIDETIEWDFVEEKGEGKQDIEIAILALEKALNKLRTAQCNQTESQS